MTHPSMTRRSLGLGAFAGAAGLAGLAACSGEDDDPGPDNPDGELRQVRVNTGLGLFQGREAYLTLAQEKGFFAEEGIELEVLPGRAPKST